MSAGRAAALAALVEPLLPDEPALPPAEREAVVRDVVAFVAAQIAGMPSYLRAPYRLALLAFDLGALLRHGRGFSRLGASARRAHLERWSTSRLQAKRDAIKLLRSLTLLQYLDHPTVLARLEGEDGGAGPGT